MSSFNPDTKTWTTPQGRTITDIDLKVSGLEDQAIELAWPLASQTVSRSNLNDWFATEYEYTDHVGKRPVFGELRTLVALDQLLNPRSI